MTGVITLSNEGQNYIEFDVICDVIYAVRPSGLAGWVGTKLLSRELLNIQAETAKMELNDTQELTAKFELGGKLTFDLQWRDFNPTLKQPIVSIVVEGLALCEWLKGNMSKEKKLYACPRGGDDRMAYEVVLKGIPFYFERLNYAAIAAMEALSKFDKIPEVLLEDVDGVMLFSEIKPGRPETIADIGNSFMVIYNDNIVDYGIITHEATHAWAKDKWGTYNPPKDTDYMAAIESDEPPITEYAKTNPSEDLAEAVRYYVYDPEHLKEKCPVRYKIVEQMMADPDYHG